VPNSSESRFSRLLHRCVYLREELLRASERQRLARALHLDLHPALELARHDAQERDTVAVLGIHVRLQLEHEAYGCPLDDKSGSDLESYSY
jgi:hypothetical protein